MPGLLDEMVRRYPEREFLVYGDERLIYSEFRHRVRDLGKGFYRIGVKKGETVALLMGNQTEWLLVDFAVTMLGGTLLGLNTWWRQRELHYALAHAEASVLVLVDRYLKHDYLAMVQNMENRNEAVPKLREIVCLGGGERPGIRSLAEIWELGKDIPDSVIDQIQETVEPGDVAYLLYTSGSTAWPKAVPVQHYGLIENMHGIGERMHLTEKDRMLLGVSLFWIFACGNALFAVMTHGSSIVLQHRFDPEEALMLIKREHCTALYAVPNMALALHGCAGRGGRDLSSLRSGLTLPPAVPHLIELGATEVASCYGLTECYGNSTVNDGRDSPEIRTRTCGRPLPGTEVVIADPQTHRPLAQGDVGEIKIRGYVTKGYHRPENSSHSPFDKEGFFLTGDLGLFDKAGYLHFRGRIKEMVKTGGINVAPAEVEEVLLSCSSIDQAIVVGIPDSEKDEVLAAAVVFREGDQMTVDELRQFCRTELAAYKVPAQFAFMTNEEMPLTDTGKVNKRGLQEWFISRLKKQGESLDGI